MPQNISWKFSLSTQESWNVLYADCAAARRSIRIEQYILADDEEGKRFLSLFCQKAREGKEVCLMLDKVGSRSVYFSKWPEKLRKAGATIRFFNPVDWHDFFSPKRWFPRDHCKIAIIDDRIAHIGSTCIEKSMRNWRDTHLRIKGALTDHFKKAFNQLWKHPGRAEYQSPREEDVRLITGKPVYTHFYQELLERMKQAKQEIYIVGPYFMPSRRFLRAMKAAARRSVNVHMIVTGVTDSVLTDCVAQSYFHTLLKGGVKIFIYQNTVLHTKYLIVDDNWATIGSMNFDYLSFFHNRESSLAVTNKLMLKQLKEQALADLQQSTAYTLKEWQQRPWYYKLLGFIGRPMKRVL